MVRAVTCRRFLHAAARPPSARARRASCSTSALRPTTDPTTGTITLRYAAEGNPGADFGFAARVVPENVTLLPKTTAQTNGGRLYTYPSPRDS